MCIRDSNNRAKELLSRNTNLVHYTSAEAAISIIDKQQLWLRHITLMNDFSEFSYGVEKVSTWGHINRNALDQLSQKFLNFDFFRMFSFVDQSFWQNVKFNTYALSLSEHPIEENDHGRLSMWRSYGKSGGVALVMKPNFINQDDMNSSVYPLPARYWTMEKVTHFFDGLLVSMQSYLASKSSVGPEDVQNISYQFLLLLCSLKHPAFTEEREWRLVANTERLGTGLISESLENIRGIPQKILKFDISNSQKYNLSNMLERVIVGPHPAAKEIAEAIETKLSMNNFSSPVILSDIPFREGT